MAQAELGIKITANNQSKAAFGAVKKDILGIKSALGDMAKFAGGNLLAAGLQSGVRALAVGVKGMIGSFAAMSREAADFNAQISTIGAVLGATANEMGQLKKLASDLGIDPNLKVSATEAAQAIEMLGRNGIKIPDIMNGAAKATVLLSNATGADFSTAADIASSAMSVFGISANDVVKAVDGITSVTTNSKMGINDYALAIAQGAGVAASAGVSFDDYNAYLVSTASLFKSGSDSGTAFKTMVMRLNPQTKEATSLMKELGLMTEDGSNAFFDSKGQMKDMAEIAGILNKTFAGMTEQQRLSTLTTLFGTDAYRSAYGLMQMTEQEFRALQATMAKTDATKAAAMRMNNLAGDMEIFQGVVDSVRIQIGDELDPALRQVFQAATSTLSTLQPVIVGFAHNIGQGFANSIEDVRGYKAEFDQLFAFFGGDKVSGMLAAIGKLTGAQVDVPIGTKIVSVDWGILKATFDRATADLSLSIGDIITGTLNLKDYTTTLSLGDFFTGTLDLKDKIASVSIGDFFAGAQIGTGGKITLSFNDTDFTIDFGAIKDTILTQLSLLKTGILVGVMSLNFSTIISMVSGGITALPGKIAEMVGGLSTFNFSSVATSIANRLKALPAAIISVIGGATGIDFSGIAEKIGLAIKLLPLLTTIAMGGITGIDFTSVATTIGNRIKALPTTIVTMLGADSIDFTAVATTVGDAMRTGINLIYGETGVMTQISGFITGTLDTISGALDSVDAVSLGLTFSIAVGGILNVIRMVAAVSLDAFADKLLAMTGAVTSITSFLSNFAAGIDATAITDAIGGFAVTLGDTVKETLTDPTLIDLGTAAGSFVKNIVGKIGEILSAPAIGSDLGEGTGDVVSGALVGALNIATGVFNELGKIDWTQFSSQMSDFTSGFLAGFGAAFVNADWGSAIKGFVNAFSAALAKFVQNPANIVFGGTPLATNYDPNSPEAKAITEPGGGSGWIPGFISAFKGALISTTLPTLKVEPPPPLVVDPPAPLTVTPPAPITVQPPPPLEFGSMPKPGWVDMLGGIINAFSGAVATAKAGGGGGGYSSSNNPSGGGGRRGFGKAPKNNAKGTANFEGGWTWVGEEGPELLNLPKGAQILSNPESKKMIGQMADGNTTAPTGAFGGLTKLLGFASSVISKSITDMTATSGQLDATVAGNTAAVDAAKAATDAAVAATTAAQASTAANTGTLATTGELIRVSAEQFAMAANDSGSFVLDGVAHFTDSFSDLLDSFGDGLESALQNVPGLFGTSEVTADQMKLAELGVDQNFADDWIRRLTDEVMNGVEWDSVSIEDAAKRAGLDPGLPAETLLEMVKQKWNDKSLFADPANLDLINMDAVQASLQQQAAAKAGEANLLALFGITPEQAQAQGATAGASAGTGLLSGISTAVAGSDAGSGLAASLSEGITEDSMAAVGATVVGGLTTEMGKVEYGEQMAGAVAGLFTSFLENAEALKGVAQAIMEKVAAQFATVTGLDMVSKFAESFNAQLATTTAKESLAKVGEQILELVYSGYLGAAEEKNWAEGVNAKAKEPPTTTTTETVKPPGQNAVGTSNWRGGLTWVGETGPELVNLPARSQIYSNSQSMAMAGGSAVNVTINATVADGLDIEQLAHRVVDVISSRRR